MGIMTILRVAALAACAAVLLLARPGVADDPSATTAAKQSAAPTPATMPLPLPPPLPPGKTTVTAVNG
jgi:hypothetical protein